MKGLLIIMFLFVVLILIVVGSILGTIYKIKEDQNDANEFLAYLAKKQGMEDSK